MGSNLLERARSDLYTINANQHKEKTDLKDSTSSPDINYKKGCAGNWIQWILKRPLRQHAKKVKTDIIR